MADPRRHQECAAAEELAGGYRPGVRCTHPDCDCFKDDDDTEEQWLHEDAESAGTGFEEQW